MKNKGSDGLEPEIVLIIDDEESIRRILSRILDPYGFTICHAGSGEEALLQAAALKPDLVLMDVNLPGINGFETCRRLLKMEGNQDLPVVFVTGMNDELKRTKIFKAGGVDYISKPFESDEVKAIVHTHIQNIRMQKQLKSELLLLETEIKERKIIEKKVRESQERLNMILDVIPIGIGITTQDGQILLSNKEIQKFHGQDLMDSDSKIKAGDLYYDKKDRDRFVKLLASGSVNNFETRFRHKDGHIIWGSLSSVLRKTEDGQFQYITSLTDITHRKKMEKEKQILQTQLIQSDKMVSIGRLAAGVAHEINNPLGFVSSNLNTLSDYYQDISTFLKTCDEVVSEIKKNHDSTILTDTADRMISLKETLDISYLLEDGQELLKDCREGLDRINKIIMDLKGFAHPGKVRKEYTDINAGIESTLNVISNEVKYKAVIKKEFGEMPPIMAFPQQLNQVFMNIIINAADAMDKRKDMGEICIKTRHENRMNIIEISDNGCGISEEDQSRVFDPFFTTKEVGKGTGLGMNIAYGIIQKHNGEISLISEKEKGTTFIIRLPVDGNIE